MEKRKIYLIFVIVIALMVFSGHFLNKDGQLNKAIADTESYDPYQNHNYDSTDYNNSNKTSNSGKTSSQSKYDAQGYCAYVVDGDTIDVDGVGRIRFVGVNTPERGEPGYKEAKDFIKQMCLGKTIYLDIDDKKHFDRYGRVLAVVYVNGANINQELLKKNLAEVMFIPPSEFNPYSWT
ncbi:thermonuclease family protein [Methanobrevibacter curvatus]|uniref:Thermonuclease n=1 Tax=Methanobrevibacter curvatus TaxID=49547 RepID=A0A162FDR7_9EURY|nr:thermonuclease family protein [Methanobrevibacter curvatus]KZX11525.1 thermonuclease precursor [Methanobrevibacter curvatus]